jgi:two-component system, cell cycle response regulator DivK
MQKKILIVDDDARNIFALTSVLKTKGFSCVTAVGALEGLKLLKTTDDIGVVLLDMMMPEMDGYEVLSKMRQGSIRHLPIIAVTAQAMVGDREKCLDAGADGYISKPIDVDILLAELNNYLG